MKEPDPSDTGGGKGIEATAAPCSPTKCLLRNALPILTGCEDVRASGRPDQMIDSNKGSLFHRIKEDAKFWTCVYICLSLNQVGGLDTQVPKEQQVFGGKFRFCLQVCQLASFKQSSTLPITKSRHPRRGA